MEKNSTSVGVGANIPFIFSHVRGFWWPSEDRERKLPPSLLRHHYFLISLKITLTRTTFKTCNSQWISSIVSSPAWLGGHVKMWWERRLATSYRTSHLDWARLTSPKATGRPLGGLLLGTLLLPFKTLFYFTFYDSNTFIHSISRVKWEPNRKNADLVKAQIIAIPLGRDADEIWFYHNHVPAPVSSSIPSRPSKGILKMTHLPPKVNSLSFAQIYCDKGNDLMENLFMSKRDADDLDNCLDHLRPPVKRRRLLEKKAPEMHRLKVFHHEVMGKKSKLRRRIRGSQASRIKRKNKVHAWRMKAVTILDASAPPSVDPAPPAVDQDELLGSGYEQCASTGRIIRFSRRQRAKQAFAWTPTSKFQTRVGKKALCIVYPKVFALDGRDILYVMYYRHFTVSHIFTFCSLLAGTTVSDTVLVLFLVRYGS